MDCVIDIKGIGTGEYEYKFLLGNSFFESFGGDLVVGAELEVDFIVTRSADWIKVDCSASGQVDVECDRCLADLTIPVDMEKSFTVKFIFSAEEDEYGDDVIVLSGDNSELDMRQIVYDYVILSLPLKKVHLDGECDPVMVAKMKVIQKENINIE